MEVIWNQLIIALAVAAVVAAVVVVEEVGSIGKFACVVFFLYMCAEIDSQRVIHEKFSIYGPVFFQLVDMHYKTQLLF
jgi:hypothetical protein